MRSVIDWVRSTFVVVGGSLLLLGVCVSGGLVLRRLLPLRGVALTRASLGAYRVCARERLHNCRVASNEGTTREWRVAVLSAARSCETREASAIAACGAAQGPDDDCMARHGVLLPVTARPRSPLDEPLPPSSFEIICDEGTTWGTWH